MSRRAAGEGSIYQRADGKWVCAVSLGWAEGKRRRKTVYADTQAEVLRKLREVTRAQDEGRQVPTGRGQTVEAFLARWLEGLPGTVKVSTEDSYRAVVRLYITPALGRIRLDRLGPDDVAAMLGGMKARGLSARTQRYARAVLRRALRHAERWGLVARNAAALVEGPRVEQREGRTLTPEQARSLLETARGHRLEPFIAVALACGLRRGEALALRWSDVDLDEGTITVRGTLQRIRGQLVVTEPKTKGSRRRVELPASCTAMLRAHRVRQAEERLRAGASWAGGDWLLTNAMGGSLDPDNVRRSFSKLTKAAGLGHWTPHELRHSAASLLLAQGVPLEVVSDLLGHASIRMTKDVYGHLLRPQRRHAAEAMDRLLSP